MSRSATVRIETPRFTIEGSSRAGVESWYRVRELGLALDLGRCPDNLVGVSRIMLTHAHIDHAAGVPYYAAQRKLQRLDPGTVYVPAARPPCTGSPARCRSKTSRFVSLAAK